MKKLLIVMILAIFVISGCGPQAPQGECSVQTDCSAKDNCEVHCIDAMCDYECEEELPTVEEVLGEGVEPAPEPMVIEPVGEPIVVEPIEQEAVEVNPEPVPGYSQADLDKYARKDIYPIEISDPRQYLSLSNEIDMKRISTDKGELRSLTFTVRNLKSEPIDVEVQALLLGFQVNGKAAKVEKEFDIPQIPPGFKYTKKYPQTIYFEDIEMTKTIELNIKEKYTDPSTITQTVKRSFVPYDEFESLEITW